MVSIPTPPRARMASCTPMSTVTNCQPIHVQKIRFLLPVSYGSLVLVSGTARWCRVFCVMVDLLDGTPPYCSLSVRRLEAQPLTRALPSANSPSFFPAYVTISGYPRDL